MDFLKNRSGSHSDRFFSGNILRPEDHEAEAGSQSSTGPVSYTHLIFFCVCEWIFSDQYTDASAGFTGSVHSAGMAEKGNRLQPPDPEHLHENRIIKPANKKSRLN